MKKFLFSLICGLLLLNSTGTFAGDNLVSIAPDLRFNENAALFNMNFKYERNIIPFLSAYVKITPTTEFEYEGDKFSYSNFDIGARYNVLFFFVGAGYGSSTGSYDQGALKADITVSGFTLEIGQKYGLGPISFAYSIGTQFADVGIKYPGSEFDVGLFETGAQTMTSIGFELGVSF